MTADVRLQLRMSKDFDTVFAHTAPDGTPLDVDATLAAETDR